MFKAFAVLAPFGWRLWWGKSPLPEGAQAVGVLIRDGDPAGALIELASGTLVQGNSGVLHPIPQTAALAALEELKSCFPAEYLASLRDE